MTEFLCRELEPGLWGDLENLFGSRGACGGCWCMYWRVRKGEKWDEMKGRTNKLRFKRMVLEGKAHGALAYSGDEPVGWCSFDMRKDYFRLDRAPSLKCDDASDVWSIPCFYIKSTYRGRGVSTALLSFAVKTLKSKYRARVIEGYPVLAKSNARIPAAFAWTGTYSLFHKADFRPAGSSPGRGKRRVRLCP